MSTPDSTERSERFQGFPDGRVRLTPVPGPFFTELLPQIDHLGELKVTIYIFWRLDRMEGVFRFLRRVDLLADERFLSGLDADPHTAAGLLDEALERAVGRGSILSVSVRQPGGEETYYFLNSPKGRAAVEAIAAGRWRPANAGPAPEDAYLDHPNIFRLYEENVGPLTPLIAEALGEAQDTYPEPWIEEAFQIAVEYNKRSWRYIEAILKRWQEEGRDEGTDRRDSAQARRRYIEGELSDYIEH